MVGGRYGGSRVCIGVCESPCSCPILKRLGVFGSLCSTRAFCGYVPGATTGFCNRYQDETYNDRINLEWHH